MLSHFGGSTFLGTTQRSMTDDQPSKRVVLQRVRNRIIEVLSDIDGLTEMYGPFEVINLWEDWVREDTLPLFVDPVFSQEEREAIGSFHITWDEVAEALPDEQPDLAWLAKSADWERLKAAAVSCHKILIRGGKFSEEHEISYE